MSQLAVAALLFLTGLLFVFCEGRLDDRNVTSIPRRLSEEAVCDSSSKSNPAYKRYFDGLASIYRGKDEGTCVPVHKECGWPMVPKTTAGGKKLPLLVLSVGLEGAGHHLWTEILDRPVFDCVWINGRHYHRDIADGVPRTSVMSNKPQALAGVTK